MTLPIKWRKDKIFIDNPEKSWLHYSEDGGKSVLRFLIRFAALSLLCLTFVSVVLARKSKEFKFEQISADDWAVSEDSAKGIHDAAMIFEKITVDDRKIVDNKVYVSIYRRIRVLSREGRSWGDVNVPFFYKDQKLKSAVGRVIRRDGDTTYLKKDQIIEKEVFRKKRTKIKQYSFSLAGLSDDCIIEYRLKLQLPGGIYQWAVQKNIVLLSGELRWKLFQGKGIPESYFKRTAHLYSPLYLLDPMIPVDVERLPSLKETNELVFTVSDVAPFEPEPFSLPEDYLRGRIRIYYGPLGSSSAFWGEMSRRSQSQTDEFIGDTKRIKKLAGRFDSLATDMEKCKAAYRWIQDSIKNLTYLCNDCDYEKEARKFKTADKAIKNRIGSSAIINIIYYDLLREMNIDAKMAWVVDRDEDIFVEDFKQMQFNRKIVAIPQDEGGYTFCAPGELFLPFGRLPWYNEGIKAMFIGATDRIFNEVPVSACTDNRTYRSLELTLSDDYEITGVLREQISGQRARTIRLQIYEEEEAEQRKIIRELLEDTMDAAEIDSVTVANVSESEKPLIIECHLNFPSVASELAGGRLLLNPVKYIQTFDDPFTSDSRTQVIVFDYAYDLQQTLTLVLPDNWRVGQLPDDAQYTSSFGTCGVSFESFDNNLSVSSVFRIQSPFYSVGQYADAQAFFDTHNAHRKLVASIEPAQTASEN